MKQPICRVWGDLAGVRGDVDECGLTDAQRKRGVNAEELITMDKDIRKAVAAEIERVTPPPGGGKGTGADTGGTNGNL